MQNRRKEQGLRETVRFRQLASQGQGFLNPLQSLFWSAEKPKRPSGKALHRNSRVLRIQESINAMSLRIVKREGLLIMFQGQSKLSQMQEDDLHSPVASHRESGVREALRQAQKFLGDLAGNSELRPQCMICPEPPENFSHIRGPT